MANKALLALGLVAAIGVTAVIVKSKQVETPKILSESDIMASVNLNVLDAEYQVMNELFVTGQIMRVVYDQLYAAYVARFNQLIGGQ